MTAERAGQRGIGVVATVSAVAVGVALVVSAIAKAWTPTGTYDSIAGAAAAVFGAEVMSGGAARGAVTGGVVALIVVEIVVGGWLCAWPGARRVRWVAAGMMGVFALYGLGLIVIGAPVGCGCGVSLRLPGVDDRWLSVVRAVLLGAAVGPWMLTVASERGAADGVGVRQAAVGG